jgi:hypothetical protein
VVEWAGDTGPELDANAGDAESEGVSANGEQTEAIIVGEENDGSRSQIQRREEREAVGSKGLKGYRREGEGPGLLWLTLLKSQRH